ncbi:MAG TPA: protein kinase [Candidatus Blautia faecipullorum]|nr:protein kinase [Candidatus Blautia faecipullorum]
MAKNLCMGCMREISENDSVCPYCGYAVGTGVSEAYYLEPRTVLSNKYMVGKVLGYGGFGVTYIGYDLVMEQAVAVKEYFPSDFATRGFGSRKLTVYPGDARIQFENGLRGFIEEARRLAQCSSIPEIVRVYDCFRENETGYIIMEFLKGQTVRELLQQKGRLPYEEAEHIILHVLEGLSAVHKVGIIHRDIAPDNIFIMEDGTVKLLDFGAARYAASLYSRSLSVILKPGYAPEEQYRSHGEQGPWTDVYGAGASFYRMITGLRPEEALERMIDDQLRKPSELGVQIPPEKEAVLLKSLAVHRRDRISSAEEFRRLLLENTEKKAASQERENDRPLTEERERDQEEKQEWNQEHKPENQGRKSENREQFGNREKPDNQEKSENREKSGNREQPGKHEKSENRERKSESREQPESREQFGNREKPESREKSENRERQENREQQEKERFPAETRGEKKSRRARVSGLASALVLLIVAVAVLATGLPWKGKTGVSETGKELDITDKSGTGTETDTVTENEPESESEAEAGNEPESESGSGAEGESEADNDTEKDTVTGNETENESEAEAENESEADSEEEKDTVTENEPENESEPGAENESEADSEEEKDTVTESEPENESKPGAENESEADSEEEKDTVAESETESESEAEAAAALALEQKRSIGGWEEIGSIMTGGAIAPLSIEPSVSAEETDDTLLNWLDGVQTTTWRTPEGNTGVGESVTFTFSGEERISGMYLFAGSYSSEMHEQMSRPKKITLEFDDAKAELEIEDTMRVHYLVLDEPVNSETVTVHIDEIYESAGSQVLQIQDMVFWDDELKFMSNYGYEDYTNLMADSTGIISSEGISVEKAFPLSAAEGDVSGFCDKLGATYLSSDGSQIRLRWREPIDRVGYLGDYDAIIGAYLCALEENWSREKYLEEGLNPLIGNFEPEEIGIRMIDLNGDGILELLIGPVYSGDNSSMGAVLSREVYEIYTSVEDESHDKALRVLSIPDNTAFLLLTSDNRLASVELWGDGLTSGTLAKWGLGSPAEWFMEYSVLQTNMAEGSGGTSYRSTGGRTRDSYSQISDEEKENQVHWIHTEYASIVQQEVDTAFLPISTFRK